MTVANKFTALGLAAALTAGAAAAESAETSTAYITGAKLSGSELTYTIENIGENHRTFEGQVWYIQPNNLSSAEMHEQLSERLEYFNRYLKDIGGKIPVSYSSVKDSQPKSVGEYFLLEDIDFSGTNITNHPNSAQPILKDILNAANHGADIIDWPKTNAAANYCNTTDLIKVDISYDGAGHVTLSNNNVSNTFTLHATDKGRIAEGTYYMSESNFINGGSTDNGINYAGVLDPDQNAPYCRGVNSDTLRLEP